MLLLLILYQNQLYCINEVSIPEVSERKLFTGTLMISVLQKKWKIMYPKKYFIVYFFRKFTGLSPEHLLIIDLNLVRRLVLKAQQLKTI